MFHVLLLKKKVGSGLSSAVLPAYVTNGVQKVQPVAILDRRAIKKGNIVVTEVLVQWLGYTANDATWEV